MTMRACGDCSLCCKVMAVKVMAVDEIEKRARIRLRSSSD
jgi:hypothetical protein